MVLSAQRHQMVPGRSFKPSCSISIFGPQPSARSEKHANPFHSDSPLPLHRTEGGKAGVLVKNIDLGKADFSQKVQLEHQ